MTSPSFLKNSFRFLKNMYEIMNFTKKSHSHIISPILQKKFNFKINKNENIMKDYEKHEKLGESKNPVFRITHKLTKKEFALKEI